MKLYHYEGYIFICSNDGSRIQPYINDVTTGRVYKPVVTSRNKKFGFFWNNASISSHSKKNFYFFLNTEPKRCVRNLKGVYSREEITELHPELLI